MDLGLAGCSKGDPVFVAEARILRKSGSRVCACQNFECRLVVLVRKVLTSVGTAEPRDMCAAVDFTHRTTNFLVVPSCDVTQALSITVIDKLLTHRCARAQSEGGIILIMTITMTSCFASAGPGSRDGVEHLSNF